MCPLQTAQQPLQATSLAYKCLILPQSLPATLTTHHTMPQTGAPGSCSIAQQSAAWKQHAELKRRAQPQQYLTEAKFCTFCFGVPGTCLQQARRQHWWQCCNRATLQHGAAAAAAASVAVAVAALQSLASRKGRVSLSPVSSSHATRSYNTQAQQPRSNGAAVPLVHSTCLVRVCCAHGTRTVPRARTALTA